MLQGVLMLERSGPAALRDEAKLVMLRAAWPSAPIGTRPGLARLLLELGEPGAARSLLESCSVNGFAPVPRDIGYLGALANLAMLAIRLEDRARAAMLYELLAPYPHHNTLNVLLLYEGSVSYFLARLAMLLGRDGVETHFDAALAMNEALGQRPQLARTCHEYARWLSTGNKAAQKKARDLQNRAQTLAQSMGMAFLLERIARE
jgi:hypothetical protein